MKTRPNLAGIVDKGNRLATKAAVVALLIALLIRLAICILVLLSVAIAGAIVMVRVFVSLLLCGTEAVPRPTIGAAVVHAILIAHLLGRIFGAAPSAVSGIIWVVPVCIPAVPIPVISDVIVIGFVVSRSISSAVLIVVILAAIVTSVVVCHVFLCMPRSLLISRTLRLVIVVIDWLLLSLILIVLVLMVAILSCTIKDSYCGAECQS